MINAMTVNDMTDISEIVSVDGAGTDAVVSNSEVTSIPAPESGADAWTGFQANNGGTVTVRDSTISNVNGYRSLVNSIAGSTITVERVDIVDAVGATSIVSTLLFVGPVF